MTYVIEVAAVNKHTYRHCNSHYSLYSLRGYGVCEYTAT
jgi:hypothetical protein